MSRTLLTTERPARRKPARASAGARATSAKRLLDDPLRRRIMKAVEASPGLPLSHLLTRLDVGWSTLYREMDALEKAGLVKSRKRGRHCLVFPAVGEKAPAKIPITQAVLLQGKTAREIATRIAKKPGQDMETLAEHLDLSPRVVYYHLRRLVEGKLIKSSSTTRYRDLAPTPILQDLLKTLGKRK